MEREVESFIQNLPDVDLLEYTRCQTHLPEALNFAKVELAKRKLNHDSIKALNNELQSRIKAREEQIRATASEPLPGKWRIAVLLSGLYFAVPLLFFVPAWLRFRDVGSEQKCRDMCVFAGIGFALQPILILLRIPPWSWLLRLF